MATFGKSDPILKIVLFGPESGKSTGYLKGKIFQQFAPFAWIPGENGFSSGVGLNLFNHRPFKLTFLSFGRANIKQEKSPYSLNTNQLWFLKWNEATQIFEHQVNSGFYLKEKFKSSRILNEFFKIQPSVKKECSDAFGFVYLFNNEHLASLDMTCVENKLIVEEFYNVELHLLMKEVSKKHPLLVLSCNSNQKQNNVFESSVNEKRPSSQSISCFQIVKLLRLNELDRDCLVVDCNVERDQMHEIGQGLDWILHKTESRFYDNID